MRFTDIGQRTQEMFTQRLSSLLGDLLRIANEIHSDGFAAAEDFNGKGKLGKVSHLREFDRDAGDLKRSPVRQRLDVQHRIKSAVGKTRTRAGQRLVHRYRFEAKQLGDASTDCLQADLGTLRRRQCQGNRQGIGVHPNIIQTNLGVGTPRDDHSK
ncbi:hypothetical protein D3C76_1144010 [compost metagenome]